jgi:hypothetical protein
MFILRAMFQWLPSLGESGSSHSVSWIGLRELHFLIFAFSVETLVSSGRDPLEFARRKPVGYFCLSEVCGFCIVC